MASGSWVEKRGVKGRERWLGRVPLPSGHSPWVPLSEPGEAMSPERAKEKLAALIESGTAKGNLEILVARLRERFAPRRASSGDLTIGSTVKEFGEAWTSGELLKKHGRVNGLRPLKDAYNNALRMAKYVYPAIGHRPVASITEQDIERLLGALPEHLDAETRIRIYAVMMRLFDLAIRPGRLREDSPVSKYLRPSKGAGKLFSYLYPAELLAVLKVTDIPPGRRLLYALAVYTGLRKGSLYALRWRDLDLVSGTVTALVTKNGMPQHFAIFFEGLRIALKKWHLYRGKPSDDDLVIRDEDIEVTTTEAETLRADLKLAGVSRELLFSDAANVEPLRFHDLRASFVTWCRRAGYAESFITDRTGHLNPAMVERYARAAHALGDLKIKPFPDISNAIVGLPDLDPTTPPTSRGNGHLGSKKTKNSKPSKRKARAKRGARGCRILRARSRKNTIGASKQVDREPHVESIDGTSGVIVGAAEAVEVALAEALTRAAAAGRFDVVQVLARQLEERQRARAGECARVVDLDAERRKRGGA